MTILSFVAVFAALTGQQEPDAAHGLILVGGVFIGSASWWLFLSTSIATIRHKLDANAQQWINRISGTYLTLAGLWSLLEKLPGK